MITIDKIAVCIRPQFVWDKKGCKWFLANQDRLDEFFCKEIGILTFINVCDNFNIEPTETINFLGVEDMAYKRVLDDILQQNELTDYYLWKYQKIKTKSALTVNLIKHRVIFGF
jgi:hypothetical protein